jgi:rSAM/selenodomain-associated transferase 1
LQCNYGAAIASGEILVFLHADTMLPGNTFDNLSEIFRGNRVEIGNFRIAFDTKHWFLTFLSFVSRLDPGFFRFGDQGMVIRKSLFDDLGGFPDCALFEDMALVRKARKKTGIHRFPMTITTSARRFQKNGIIRQQLINTYYTIQYLLGVPPWRLAEKYYGHKKNGTDTRLAIVLRSPASDSVKTRLAKTAGSEVASRFYKECVHHLLGEIVKLPSGIARYVYYTPKGEGESVQRLAGPSFRLRPQVGGDLGRKLKLIFRVQFRSGARKVIVVATDVPEIAALDIEEAFHSLDEADLVLGPSVDGGYYLIGMTEFHPRLFQDISWSTDVVYKQTFAAAQELGLKVHSLRCLEDVDTEDDLRRWQRRAELKGRVCSKGAEKVVRNAR